MYPNPVAVIGELLPEIALPVCRICPFIRIDLIPNGDERDSSPIGTRASSATARRRFSAEKAACRLNATGSR